MGNKEQKIQMILERIERMDAHELELFESALDRIVRNAEESTEKVV